MHRRPSSLDNRYQFQNFVFVFVFVHFAVMGNSSRFPQGKPAATESSYPTLICYYKVHAGSFRVCFHNPPNSDMDCRIVNVRIRTWSFLCVGVELGTPTTASQHKHFRLRKKPHSYHFFLCFLAQTGFEPRVFGSGVRSDALTNSATHVTKILLQNNDRKPVNNPHVTFVLREWFSCSAS